MDATEGMKKAIEQLRKDTDETINRLHNEIKESKSTRQRRKAEQHRTE
ncbi:unnamed protein product [marine sediment metagenome]|uniref:Uncharacterized protein n=1 Tax=marine sediment metagenome TaxID=412755 RepID=X1V7M4_9ZZZZ